LYVKDRVWTYFCMRRSSGHPPVNSLAYSRTQTGAHAGRHSAMRRRAGTKINCLLNEIITTNIRLRAHLWCAPDCIPIEYRLSLFVWRLGRTGHHAW
jgi:hypothetical protein